MKYWVLWGKNRISNDLSDVRMTFFGLVRYLLSFYFRFCFCLLLLSMLEQRRGKAFQRLYVKAGSMLDILMWKPYA